ncbi:MAG: alcohol dehydrogenase catalytic domain-containing protein [Actinobacteria bacterium]|nr:alcohol dehydrogenase catalytic domain-containing protein [Actinomycetota bacterium]
MKNVKNIQKKLKYYIKYKEIYMSKLEKYINDFQDYKIPKKMKATVLSGIGFENISVKEVPVPTVSPKQLLARVDAAGVCTSILKIIEQGAEHKYFNGWDPAKWPTILGDESSLTIVKVGRELEGKYFTGKRYGIQPAVAHRPINHLERYNNNGKGMEKTAVGYTLSGLLAEYMLIQEEVIEGGCLVPLPDDNLAYFEVSMAEPISCVISAQTRHIHFYKDYLQSPRYAKLGIKEDGVCIVVGAGAMGLIHIELAMRFRPKILIVNDLLEERLSWVDKVLKPKAGKKGIKLITVTPDKIYDLLTNVSNGKMADDIILAVGIKQVQQEAFKWLGFGGVINLFGGLKKGDSLLKIDNMKVHYEEIKVAGSSGGDPADYIETLEAINNNDIDAGNYVAAVGSIDNSIKVLNMIKNNQIQGKAILYPHIKQMDLKMVNYWSKEKENKFLEKNLK